MLSALVEVAFVALAAVLAFWVGRLRGVIEASEKNIELYELGKRDGLYEGVEKGRELGRCEVANVSEVFTKLVLDVLEIPEAVQQAAIRSVAETIEEERQVGTEEDLEKLGGL